MKYNNKQKQIRYEPEKCPYGICSKNWIVISTNFNSIKDCDQCIMFHKKFDKEFGGVRE